MKNKFSNALSLALIVAMLLTSVALASTVDESVVDATAPTGSVTLNPGGTGAITINLTVTGRQDNPSTFDVYRDWTLSGGTFVGSNPQTFTVPPRAATDPATTFSTSGTVAVDSGQGAGTFTLAVGAFNIVTTAPAALAARNSSNYVVTVEIPAPTDTTAPTITITTPANDATYLLNQVVYADYFCEDEAGGSGLVSCVGTLADGAAIDTSMAGSYSFTVNAADNAGNTSSVTVNYTVAYNLCALYDQTKSHKAGSTVPLKLQLCDVNGVNYSSFSIVVKAISVSKLDNSASSLTEDSGNANPDYNFRYDATLGGTGGYIYNLSTKGFTSGTWTVTFTVDGLSASTYFVKFDVK